MNKRYLLDIISGRTNGLVASLVRTVFTCLSWPYRIAISIRNQCFNSGIGVQQVDATVISVGNLTTGGTGKTPHIALLARHISDKCAVAIASRGYGSVNGKPNDEAIELSWLVDVPHFQDADRVSAANTAIRDARAKCVLLDDGFQHRRLARDLDIVLIDATCPFGHNALLPRGLLREPISSLARADIALLTRSNLVAENKRTSILSKVKTANPNVVVAETKIAVNGLIDSDRTRYPLSAIEGSVFAVCGVGNPTGFFKTLSENSIDISGTSTFNDHHSFSESDINRIAAEACDCSAIVCTLKDLVKINRRKIGNIPIFALAINVEFVSGEEEFYQLIEKTIGLSITDTAKSDSGSSDANAA